MMLLLMPFREILMAIIPHKRKGMEELDNAIIAS
jgi:hypothetical protein